MIPKSGLGAFIDEVGTDRVQRERSSGQPRWPAANSHRPMVPNAATVQSSRVHQVRLVLAGNELEPGREDIEATGTPRPADRALSDRPACRDEARRRLLRRASRRQGSRAGKGARQTAAQRPSGVAARATS